MEFNALFNLWRVSLFAEINYADKTIANGSEQKQMPHCDMALNKYLNNEIEFHDVKIIIAIPFTKYFFGLNK